MIFIYILLYVCTSRIYMMNGRMNTIRIQLELPYRNHTLSLTVTESDSYSHFGLSLMYYSQLHTPRTYAHSTL